MREGDGSRAASVTVEAELSVPAASVQIVQMRLVEPVDNVLREDDSYRLDLSLTPRFPNAAMCFTDHWAPHRFEPPGRVFLLPPGEHLRVKSGIGQQGAIICHLSARALKEWLDAEIEWTDRRLDASLDIANAAIGSLLLQLGEEARHPGFASEIMAEAIAVQIAVTLHRYLIGIEDKASPGGLASWRLRIIDDRLEEHAELPTLAELASLCRLSTRQLSRGFRASRGISIGTYIADKRLERAKQLLAQGTSVKSVAYTMGFGSPSSFGYAFRRSTGLAPGQFRQRAGYSS